MTYIETVQYCTTFGFSFSDSFQLLDKEFIGTELFSISFNANKIISGRWDHYTATVALNTLHSNKDAILAYLRDQPKLKFEGIGYFHQSSDPKLDLYMASNKLRMNLSQPYFPELSDAFKVFNSDPVKWALNLDEIKMVNNVSFFLNPKRDYYLKSVKVHGAKVLIVRFRTKFTNIMVFKDGKEVDVFDEIFSEALNKLQLLSGM